MKEVDEVIARLRGRGINVRRHDSQSFSYYVRGEGSIRQISFNGSYWCCSCTEFMQTNLLSNSVGPAPCRHLLDIGVAEGRLAEMFARMAGQTVRVGEPLPPRVLGGPADESTAAASSHVVGFRSGRGAPSGVVAGVTGRPYYDTVGGCWYICTAGGTPAASVWSKVAFPAESPLSGTPALAAQPPARGAAREQAPQKLRPIEKSTFKRKFRLDKRENKEEDT